VSLSSLCTISEEAQVRCPIHIWKLSREHQLTYSTGVAADISHINTKSVVKGYDPTPSGLREALKGAEVVLIPAGVPRKPGMTRDGMNEEETRTVEPSSSEGQICSIPTLPLSAIWPRPLPTPHQMQTFLSFPIRFVGSALDQALSSDLTCGSRSTLLFPSVQRSISQRACTIQNVSSASRL
jgi:lactate/malate dehydrogenase, NAD binding domain